MFEAKEDSKNPEIVRQDEERIFPLQKLLSEECWWMVKSEHCPIISRDMLISLIILAENKGKSSR